MASLSIFEALLSSDNAVRKAAEAAYTSFLNEHPVQVRGVVRYSACPCVIAWPQVTSACTFVTCWSRHIWL